MHTRRLAAALLLAITLSAGAAEPPRNGALDYLRAGLLVQKADPKNAEPALPNLDWEKIGANLDPAAMPPEFQAAKKELSADAVEHFIRAAAAPVCDFQPHTEDGWKMLLPELATVRTLARHARFDARVKLMAGDPAPAAARLTAMYHAAAHVSLENTLISTLVGAAIAKSADDEVKVLVGSGKLGESDRVLLLEAVRSLKNDGLRFHAALEGEHRITSVWLKKEYTGPGAPARFVKEFMDMSKEASEADKHRADAVASLTPAQFAEAASKMDTYYADMLRAWDGPEPKKALVLLETRLANNEYGPIAQVLAPAMSKARSSFDKVYADLQTAEDALTRKP